MTTDAQWLAAVREQLPELYTNDADPCCNQSPTLRVRPRLVFTSIIPYVRFECRQCGTEGGLAITLGEALFLWPEINTTTRSPTSD